MWNKLKDYFGLDEILADEPIQELKQENSNLIDLRTLQIELRKCKEEIRQKNDLLNELSTENIKLAYNLQSLRMSLTLLIMYSVLVSGFM